MNLARFAVVTLLLIFLGSPLVSASGQKDTYPETRRLLAKMERDANNEAFVRLFREADKRKADLKKALYDTQQSVNLNAQVILKYLADPQSLAALEEWYRYKRKQGKEYAVPNMELVNEV